MQLEQQGAYDLFWYTGKICDYLAYVKKKQQVENAAGESIAYHDRWNRAKRTADFRN